MKRITKVFQYMIHETARPVLIFYLVIALVNILGLSMNLVMTNWNFEFDGLRLATVIFLFVAGLNAFKSGYLFLQANSVTRRHFYWGGLIAIATLAVALTAVDAALYGLLRQFLRSGEEVAFLLYPNSGYISMQLWTLAFNLLAIAFGWFLTMLYYRCGKGLKITISVFPAVALTVLPIISKATGGKLMSALADAFMTVMGLGGNPSVWLGMITMLLVSAAFAGLCFLLVRRAPIKEQER